MLGVLGQAEESGVFGSGQAVLNAAVDTSHYSTLYYIVFCYIIILDYVIVVVVALTSWDS